MKKLKDVCELAGVSKRTLQYYDDEGLLPAERSATNERMYSEESLIRLWEILLYKEMGFKLENIKALLLLTESERLEQLDEQLKHISRKKGEIELQIGMIELVKQQGIPTIGENVGIGLTYMESVDEIKQRIRKNRK